MINHTAQMYVYPREWPMDWNYNTLGKRQNSGTARELEGLFYKLATAQLKKEQEAKATPPSTSLVQQNTMGDTADGFEAKLNVAGIPPAWIGAKVRGATLRVETGDSHVLLEKSFNKEVYNLKATTISCQDGVMTVKVPFVVQEEFEITVERKEG